MRRTFLDAWTLRGASRFVFGGNAKEADVAAIDLLAVECYVLGGLKGFAVCVTFGNIGDRRRLSTVG